MPQSAVVPGRQPTPNASKAMPVTRATGMETPVSSAPSNKRTANDGTTINANPVATSATAATVRTFFIRLVLRRSSLGGTTSPLSSSCDRPVGRTPRTASLPTIALKRAVPSILRAGDGFGGFLLVRFCVLRWAEVEPEFVDLAGELERT